jgi:hypothetical protein
MNGLPADGTDRVTPEIQSHIVELVTDVSPLSRDFRRGLQFGVTVQHEAQGGALLESILMRMKVDAPEESDLFYLGAVVSSIAFKESSQS